VEYLVGDAPGTVGAVAVAYAAAQAKS